MRANPHAGCWGEGRICSQIKARTMPLLMARACPHVVYINLTGIEKEIKKAVSDSGTEFTDVRSLSERKEKFCEASELC